MTQHPHLPPQLHLRLHRPVPTYEPAVAPPTACFILSDLYACDRWDYFRRTGTIRRPAQNPLSIQFINRPVAWWVGYGRLKKKLVEEVEVMVAGERGIDTFIAMARVGFAYKGATKRKRRKKG